MNNEQKKEYKAPKMEILVFERDANLLCASGQSGEDCFGSTWDNSEE